MATCERPAPAVADLAAPLRQDLLARDRERRPSLPERPLEHLQVEEVPGDAGGPPARSPIAIWNSRAPPAMRAPAAADSIASAANLSSGGALRRLRRASQRSRSRRHSGARAPPTRAVSGRPTAASNGATRSLRREGQSGAPPRRARRAVRARRGARPSRAGRRGAACRGFRRRRGRAAGAGSAAAMPPAEEPGAERVEASKWRSRGEARSPSTPVDGRAGAVSRSASATAAQVRGERPKPDYAAGARPRRARCRRRTRATSSTDDHPRRSKVRAGGGPPRPESAPAALERASGSTCRRQLAAVALEHAEQEPLRRAGRRAGRDDQRPVGAGRVRARRAGAAGLRSRCHFERSTEAAAVDAARAHGSAKPGSSTRRTSAPRQPARTTTPRGRGPTRTTQPGTTPSSRPTPSHGAAPAGRRAPRRQWDGPTSGAKPRSVSVGPAGPGGNRIAHLGASSSRSTEGRTRQSPRTSRPAERRARCGRSSAPPMTGPRRPTPDARRLARARTAERAGAVERPDEVALAGSAARTSGRRRAASRSRPPPR